MVYEWLSGKRPFQGKRQMEIIAQHLNDDPPPLRGKITDISREVEKNIEQVVFKALEKDPKKRFKSVKDFAKAFEQACRNCSPSKRVKQAQQEKRPVAQQARKMDQGNEGNEQKLEKNASKKGSAEKELQDFYKQELSDEHEFNRLRSKWIGSAEKEKTQEKERVPPANQVLQEERPCLQSTGWEGTNHHAEQQRPDHFEKQASTSRRIDLARMSPSEQVERHGDQASTSRASSRESASDLLHQVALCSEQGNFGEAEELCKRALAN